MEITDSDLPLQRAYGWEASAGERVLLTQPMGGGLVRDLTWRQAMDEARRMASHLRELNLPAGSHIAICGKNSAQWILADVAIWMAGHTSVPVYPTLTTDSARQILEHSQARLMFVGKLDTWDQIRAAIPEGMPAIALPLSPSTDFPTWDEIVARTDPIRDNPVRPADDIATIIYTSGSTGTPKGVMLDFNAMAAAAKGVDEAIGVNERERMLSYLPLAHVMERWLVEVGMLTYGFHVYFAESIDTFLNDLKRAQPTIFISVPRLWTNFQAGVREKVPERKLKVLLALPLLGGLVRKKVLKGLGLEHARIAGSGSAPLPAEIINWYRRLGLELLEGYGLTENFGYSHLSIPGKVRVGYVGHPNPGVEQRIGDEGEVQVRSPTTMRGYYRADEMTREAITEDGFLRTGDIGELDEQGRLKITGRLKELFKTSKGKYVSPAPIENSLVADPLIEQACVSGDSQPQPFAVVVLAEATRNALARGEPREPITAALQRLLEQVNARLDPHERLNFLAVAEHPWLTENGMLTPTMKIKRAELEKRFRPSVADWYAAGQPVVWEQGAA